MKANTTLDIASLKTQTHKRVKILDDSVVNQIAAGEVVERPASVVKELIENAIDANATEITILIDNGGRSSITVLDNGHGMTREDALLAIERFGTSKVQTIHDLQNISTLGFRGEAIPSIASVSKFRLITRSIFSESHLGSEIFLNGGKLVDVKEVPIPTGTKVEVLSLFFNVPARRRFLRTENTEAGLVKTLVIDYALAHPKLRLRLIANGKEILGLSPARDSFERTQQLKLLSSDAIRIEQSDAKLSFGLTSMLSRPIEAVTGASKLRLLVNQRSVRDKVLLSAIREGYSTFIKPGNTQVVICILL
jgi:DNA mismatch repair protein MutL